MSTLDRPPPPPPPPPPPGPMSTTAAPPRGRPLLAPPPRRLGRRNATPVAASPEGLPTRRRWGRFAAGATLALLGAWIFAALYVSAGERIDVLVLAHDVQQYQTLVDEDFRTVRVAADPGVNTVAAGKRDEMVGRTVAVPVLEGTLLAEEQLLPGGAGIVGDGERGVPVLLKPGRFPDRDFLAGMMVDIVIQSPTLGEPPETIEDCRILSVGEPDENTGEREFEIAVPLGDFKTVSAAAHDRVKLNAQPAEGP